MILQYPLKKIYITQKFGENPQIYKQFGLAGHNGLDFRAANGTEVYAATDGQVIEVINQGNRGYGKYIRIQHKFLAETVYGHLQDFRVKVGDIVRAGQLIGLADNTGFSTGSHLHFGYRPRNFNYNNGYKGYVDPLPYLEEEVQMLKEIFKGMKTVKLPNNPTVYVAVPNWSTLEQINGGRIDEVWFEGMEVIAFKGKPGRYILIKDPEMWQRLNGGKLDREIDIENLLIRIRKTEDDVLAEKEKLKKLEEATVNQVNGLEEQLKIAKINQQLAEDKAVKLSESLGHCLSELKAKPKVVEVEKEYSFWELVALAFKKLFKKK